MSVGTPARRLEPAPPGPATARRGPLRDLDRPADMFASLGPNWFASVMGTGIVATAAATLPGALAGAARVRHRDLGAVCALAGRAGRG